MAWFNKKDKQQGNLPELPPLPDDFQASLPPLEDRQTIKNELPALPSFPANKVSEKLSNEAVKQIIKEPEFRDDSFKPEDFEEVELPKQITKEITEDFKPREIRVREVRPSPKIEPVYVRIDKYQDSLSSFHDIKRKLMEIEATIKDLKDLKSKEELELQAWEEEVRKTKEKLADIDSALFQKIGD